MANEAVIIELINNGEPIRMTVGDGSTIEKGTLLQLTDPRTASATSGAGDRFIGIASAEKVASDGSTTLGVYTKGIFDLTTVSAIGPEGLISAGDLVEVSGANTIRKLSGAVLYYEGVPRAVGKALESASVGEVIAVKVGGYF